MSVTDGNNTDVEQLLTIAGPRETMAAERLERMRGAVHDAWMAETRPGAARAFIWTLVIAAAGAAAVFGVVRVWPNAAVTKPVDAPAIVRSVEITTGPAERKSLRLAGGGELRIDASSVVTIADGLEIRITKGALYLDSHGKTLPAVMTPAGRMTDAGTRFEVRIVAGSTRVRVRDGKVRLAQASTISEVGAGEELVARADLSTSRRRANPFGADWAWVARAAPRFDLEGKSLGRFIDWIEQEGGWTVAFASPALERRARSTVMSGSIERMSTTEALDTILPACGLAHRIDLKTGRVTVMAESR